MNASVDRQPVQSRRRFLESLVVGAGAVGWARSTAADDSPPGSVSVPTVQERIRADAAAAPLRMQFRGSTAAECLEWQAAFRSKLTELLRNPVVPGRWRVVREAELELSDHVREQLVLVADGLPPVPLYVLRPRSARGPRPAVLCVHGHGPHGHDTVAGRDDDPEVARTIAASNYDYARQLVREGFVTAAPCLTPFGRRLGDRSGYGSQDPCAVTFVRLQLLGRVLMAENLRDLLWTLEYLRERPDVRPDRLGCVGLSYGGRMTMLVAALEPRVRVAVISGALNCLQERIGTYYSCGAQVIPGLLLYGDVPEIGSLIAPRPCLWEIGSRDGLIDPDWAETAVERMGRAYRALGAADNLQIDRFDGGHVWHGAEAVPLLHAALDVNT